jgi:hypothetical protein
MKTIHFQDHGQDFLEWNIEKGKVVGCRPFQASIWCGSKVHNRSLKVGDQVRITPPALRERMVLRYPIERIDTKRRKEVAA